MPLRNRVNPYGDIVADPSKAAMLMGNRGILHNDQREVVRSWRTTAWLTCDPHFKHVDRKPLFQPHRYSELFFLDEATAFAAGHRPCSYCQRVRLEQFKRAWESAFPQAGALVSAPVIDDMLHRHRIGKSSTKVTFASTIGALPDGTFIEADGRPYLLHDGRRLPWSFAGYGAAEPAKDDSQVTVLTPRCIVEVFKVGFAPHVHESANA